MSQGSPAAPGARPRPFDTAQTTEGQRAPQAPQAQQTNTDESGLIDLQALMAAAQSRAQAPQAQLSDSSGNRTTPVPVVRNLDVYPFGPPAPPEPPPVPELPRQAPSQRLSPLGVALSTFGGVALAAAIVIVAFTHSPSAEPPPRSGAGMPAIPGETATLANPGTVTEAVKPVETAPPAELTPPAKPPVVPGKKPIQPGKQPVNPVKPPRPPAPPAADPCKGDLLCSMKRATEGKK